MVLIAFFSINDYATKHGNPIYLFNAKYHKNDDGIKWVYGVRRCWVPNKNNISFW